MHSKNLRQLSFDPNLKHEELEKDRLPAKNHFSRSIHFLVFCLENFFLSLIIFQNSESHQPTLVISFCIGFREFLLCECYELLAVRCDKDPDFSCLPRHQPVMQTAAFVQVLELPSSCWKAARLYKNCSVVSEFWPALLKVLSKSSLIIYIALMILSSSIMKIVA